MTGLALLAAGAPTANQVVPGVLGFIVVAAMGVALFFLLRSMSKQLRRVAGGARWEQGSAEARAKNGAGPGGAKAGKPKPDGGPTS